MGPRPIGRGNAAWLRRSGFDPDASMGPRPIGRGNLDQLDDTENPTIASMGPRPIGRGNRFFRHQLGRGTTCFNGAATNWSRKPTNRQPLSILPMSFNGAATNWSRKHV